MKLKKDVLYRYVDSGSIMIFGYLSNPNTRNPDTGKVLLDCDGFNGVSLWVEPDKLEEVKKEEKK